MKLLTPQDYFPELDSSRRIKDEYRTGDFDENSSKRVFERTMAVSGESTIHSTYNYWESDTLDEKMERAERAGKEAFEKYKKQLWREVMGATVKSALSHGIHCFPDTSYIAGRFTGLGDVVLSLSDFSTVCSAEGYDDLSRKLENMRKEESGRKSHRISFFLCVLVFLSVFIPMLCLFPGCEHLRISIPEERLASVEIIYFLVVAAILFFSVSLFSIPLALAFALQIGLLTNAEHVFDISYLILCSLIALAAFVVVCISGYMAYGKKDLKTKVTAFVQAVDACALEAHQYFVFINAWSLEALGRFNHECLAHEEKLFEMVEIANRYRAKFKIR